MKYTETKDNVLKILNYNLFFFSYTTQKYK